MVVPAWAASTVDCPDTDASLAQLPTYYGRAEQALIWGRLYAGETVLILGAEEGSGPAAVELAKLRGATAFASGPEWSLSELKARGAALVGQGAIACRVDLVVDFRTIPDLQSHQDWLSPDGVYVSVGGTVARKGSPPVQATSNSDIFTQRYLENLTHAVSRGELPIVGARTFKLLELAFALEALADPHLIGPVVVTIESS